MTMKLRVQATTKKDSARRQIEAAIAFWKKQEFDCSITLAGAAEEQCRHETRASLFETIKAAIMRRGIEEKDFVNTLNETRNWLKHKTSNLSDQRDIGETETILMLVRAISNYHAEFDDDGSDAIGEFVIWCQDHWIPKLASMEDRL